jgi:hypothetical protein
MHRIMDLENDPPAGSAHDDAIGSERDLRLAWAQGRSTERPATGGSRSLLWPSYCCVPAFIVGALCELSTHPVAQTDERLQRDVAAVLGVRVPPDDINPWALSISEEPMEWGVTVAAARDGFAEARRLIPGCEQVELEIISILEIAFEMYESRIKDLTDGGAVVAIAFDYTALGADLQRIGTGRAHHLLRLSPYGAQLGLLPNVLSPEFDFDYSGQIWTFDDSFEIGHPAILVPWRTLLASCRSIDGWLWILRRASV